jgi:hypothetical protein
VLITSLLRAGKKGKRREIEKRRKTDLGYHYIRVETGANSLT